MNRRALLVGLAVCTALVLAGLWQLSTPKERAPVLKPAEGDIFADGETTEGTPLAPSLDEPQLDVYTPAPKKLAPPPQAPTVTNDPRDRIWLRLLDSRTNQPVADTNCELFRVARDDFGFSPSRLNTRRLTDADGLMSFSSGVLEDIEFEERAQGWDVAYYWDDLENFIVPAPVGWMPVTSYHDVAAALDLLQTQASSAPIDVLVAPEATLRIVARDEWGQPVPDALIQFHPLSTGTGGADWSPLFEHLPEPCAENEWNEWVWVRQRILRRSQVEAVFDGKAAADPPSGPVIVLPGPLDEWESDPAVGSVVARGLPFLRFGAVAYRSGLGFGTATIILTPGTNELNVYLRTPLSCTLNVRIEWQGEPLEPEDVPELSVSTTGLYGESDFIDVMENNCQFEWILGSSSSNVWQGTIRNLPPGIWTLEAAFPRGADGYAQAWLQSGETESVTLYCGDGALARWTPVVRLNGGQLQRCSIRILGGANDEPETETIEYDAETRETTELELQAGTYTIWIPTLMPQPVTLGPGETRSDAFELLCAKAHFTIDAPLTELLSFEGASVQLNLFPSDAWAEAEEHLIEIDAGLRKQDEEFDQLRPGVVRVWTVPLGKYAWQLVGANQEIEGELTLTSLSESVHFGLRSLPGYELCQIEFSGFDDGAPSISIDDDSTTDYAIFAARAGSDDPEWIDDVISRLRGGTQVLHDRTSETLYAYAPRGAARITVYGDDTSLSVRATFPGRVVLSAAQLSGHVASSLELAAGESDDTWHVTAFHDDGSAGLYDAGDTVDLPVGWVTLFVTRTKGRAHSFARVRVNLTAQPQTFDLTTLSYEPYAEVTLVFRGRGSPDSPFDAWWYGDAEPTPLLLALDQTFGGSPRYVGLGYADRVLPDGRLEFTYDNRMLPPGRYKVIPWHGAAEKYCKTFTLAAGESTTVVVQGG